MTRRLHFNAAAALSLKASSVHDYYNFQSKKLFTLFVGDSSEATLFLLPYFSLDIYSPSPSFSLSLHPSRSQACSVRSPLSLLQVERARWGFSWHTFDGDTAETFPDTVNSHDSQCYRHAASPLRCSPLGSLRKRLGLFKCQFIFFAHYRECAPCSASRETACKRPM